MRHSKGTFRNIYIGSGSGWWCSQGKKYCSVRYVAFKWVYLDWILCRTFICVLFRVIGDGGVVGTFICGWCGVLVSDWCGGSGIMGIGEGGYSLYGTSGCIW